MSHSTIPYIHWVDRETAANDIFALLTDQHLADWKKHQIYQILKVLKPKHLVPELTSLLDKENLLSEEWEEILGVLQALDADIYVPELQQYLTNEIIDARRNRTDMPIKSSRIIEIRTILEIIHLAPSNRDWFWQQMSTLSAENRLYIILLGCFDLDEALAHYLLPEVFALLKENTHLIYFRIKLRNDNSMNFFLSWVMRSRGHSEIYRQIISYFQVEITELIRDEYKDTVFHWQVLKNTTLKEIILDKHPALLVKYKETCQAIKQKQRDYIRRNTEYRKLSIYIQLKKLYNQSKLGRQSPYNQLLHYARYSLDKPIQQKVDNAQLIQALALHLLGRLPITETLIEIAYALVKTTELNWPDGEVHPVFVEAINIILQIPNARAWETILNIFFASNKPNLYFAKYWAVKYIEYLTNVFSNNHLYKRKTPLNRPRERWWFEEALRYVTDEDFKRINS